MCGISGSGKSSFVRRNLKENEVHISRDNIRFSLVKENEDYFSKEKLVFKKFVEQIQDAIDDVKIKSIYADATHLNEKSRLKLLNSLTLTSSIRIIPIYFNIPLNIAIARNSRRTGREFVPISAIKNQYYNYSYPEFNEIKRFYNEIWSINEDNEITKIILESVKNEHLRNE